MKDDELEKLLAPLRAQAPSDIEMRKWELAMARESRATGTKNRLALFVGFLSEWQRLAIAMGIGIAIGALAFKNSSSPVAAIEMASATFEHSHANLD